MHLKLDQGTWFCRILLDNFWVDFGPDWTIFDQFGLIRTILSVWKRLFEPNYLDLSIWTCLFGPIYLDLSHCPHLFNPSICNGPVYLDLSIEACIFGPIYLDLSVWIPLFGTVYWGPFIWTCMLGPIYLDPISEQCSRGHILSLATLLLLTQNLLELFSLRKTPVLFMTILHWQLETA